MKSRAILTLLLPILASAVWAAEPMHEPHRDRNGDLLPEGAVARLGNARLLHGGVHHVEFSPDSKTLATSGEDGARLWDVATGKEIPVPHLPRTGDAVLTFMPDGAQVVGDGKGCRVIEPGTGKVRCSWRNPGKRPYAIVVAADGKSAVTAWKEGGVTVHDLTAGGRHPGRTLSDDETFMLALSGDGGLLAYSKEVSILLWDVRKGELLQTIEAAPKESPHFAFCLSHDGRRLAVAGGGTLHLWDTATHEEVKGFVPPESWAEFLRFSADDTELVDVSGGKRQVVRWSATTGAARHRYPEGEGQENRCDELTLSPDGRTLAAVSGPRVELWEAATWKQLFPVKPEVKWRGVAFVTPEVVVTYTRGQEHGEVLAFWDVSSGRPLRRYTVPVPEEGWWRRALSPDGRLFAAGDDKKGIVLCAVESGKQVRRFEVHCREDEQAKFAFSPDGRRLVTSDSEGLRVWDVASGRPLGELQGVSDGVMAFSPDGRSVASAHAGPFMLTEVASGKVRYSLPLPDSEERQQSEAVVDEIRFARDGRSVAVISRCDIHVFSTDRGTTLFHLFLGGRTNIWDETGDLSPDGRWLAHGNNLHSPVSVRDLHSPRAVSECQTLFGHAGSVEGVKFSPDGKYLVTCGDDGTALVWDVQQLTGKPAPDEQDGQEAQELDAQEVPWRWEVLADANPRRAAQAMAELVDSPDVAVPLLKARLQPAQAPAARQVRRLIADLDNDAYPVRAQAARELARLGQQAAPELRKALESKPSLEVTRQVEQLLSNLDGPVSDPEQLREVRAVEVLERIGTPAAREVLEALAQGVPEARLTQEAKSSLTRLSSP